MKMLAVTMLAAVGLAATSASAATVTFSGLTSSEVTQPTYTEAGVTVTSIDGAFWGYPSGGQLHLDPRGFRNSTYDFTYSGGTFDLASLDVSFASAGAIGTFTAYNAANAVIGTTSFSAATTGSRTFALNGISRLRLVDTVSHFSIDNLTLNGSRTGAVPEPASWAMMLCGFGAIGLATRRRAKPTAVTFG